MYNPSDKIPLDIDVVKDASEVDPKEHAKILRKIDWHLLPLVSLLCLLSYLWVMVIMIVPLLTQALIIDKWPSYRDRANIGNAKIAGMEVDLDLVGLRYNIAAAVFFIPYCLGQVPSNVLLKPLRPSRWLPSIMVVWGLIMTLMCLVKTFQGLVVARFFLGLAESGLFPGVAYYLSLWYPRAARARRLALFISGAIIGGGFSGLLAFGIEKMEGMGGLHGWQWIFCLEGISESLAIAGQRQLTFLVAILASLACYLLMYDFPETAAFLTETERTYLVQLMRNDSLGLATHYHRRFVMQALTDYKIYLQFLLYIGMLTPSYAITLFTPTIIKDLGFSAANTQLLSVPPFVMGSIAAILFGALSDKQQLRGPYLITGCLIAIVGYAILYTQTNPGVAYVGTVLVAIGVFSCSPIGLAWISSNAGGDIKRGVAIAMTNGFGNLGGICSAFIFFDPPQFHVGLSTIMGCLCLTILVSVIMMWNFCRLNQEKEKMCSDNGITEEQKDEFKECGDDSPLFRYTY